MQNNPLKYEENTPPLLFLYIISPLLNIYVSIILLTSIQLVKPVYLHVCRCVFHICFLCVHTHTHTHSLYTSVHVPGEYAQKLFSLWSAGVSAPDAPLLSLRHGTGQHISARDPKLF